jgi:CRP/FNR family transcriptional regulator, cyclic AMP receptor protein
LETSIPNQVRKVRVVDVFPEIVEQLDPQQELLARRHLVATLDEIPRGIWKPRREIRREPGHLGLLVLEGLLTRDVVLGDTVATELVGRGDVLRPVDHDGEDAPVPFDVVWHVLEPTRIAVLDREFARVAAHWPEVMEVLFQGAVNRAQSLAITLAVSHLRRVDARLLVIMWYLADRWGKVRRDGVNVPLKLTHQTLGRLVGAQRPSVSTSLKQLAEEGLLTRADDGTWLLHGDPPDTLQRLRERTAPERSRERENELTEDPAEAD